MALATTTWVCRRGSPARLSRWSKAAATKPGGLDPDALSFAGHVRGGAGGGRRVFEVGESVGDGVVVDGLDLGAELGPADGPQHRVALGRTEHDVPTRLGGWCPPGRGEPIDLVLGDDPPRRPAAERSRAGLARPDQEGRRHLDVDGGKVELGQCHRDLGAGGDRPPEVGRELVGQLGPSLEPLLHGAVGDAELGGHLRAVERGGALRAWGAMFVAPGSRSAVRTSRAQQLLAGRRMQTGEETLEAGGVDLAIKPEVSRQRAAPTTGCLAVADVVANLVGGDRRQVVGRRRGSQLADVDHADTGSDASSDRSGLSRKSMPSATTPYRSWRVPASSSHSR